jgi:hypothetical protein
MKRILYVSGATAICFLIAWPVLGQSFFASLSGTVVDTSGAVIPGVAIRVKNSSSGTTRSLHTNQDGYFLMTATKWRRRPDQGLRDRM